MTIGKTGPGGNGVMSSRTAVVLGASGLVGGFCLRALVDDPDYTRVLTFGRRELPSLTRAKVAQRVADLGSLTADDFQGAQDVFCALGTTIRKAGSQEAFRRIDLELPLRSAEEALKAGAEQFVVVSSVGADAASKNFYLRTKGELERELARSAVQGGSHSASEPADWQASGVQAGRGDRDEDCAGAGSAYVGAAAQISLDAGGDRRQGDGGSGKAGKEWDVYL